MVWTIIGTKKYLKSKQDRFGGMSYAAGTAAELLYTMLYDHNYICKGVGYVQSYAMFKETNHIYNINDKLKIGKVILKTYFHYGQQYEKDFSTIYPCPCTWNHHSVYFLEV